MMPWNWVIVQRARTALQIPRRSSCCWTRVASRSVRSDIVNKDKVADVRSAWAKGGAERFNELQDLMYDRLRVELSSVQLVVGQKPGTMPCLDRRPKGWLAAPGPAST